MTNREKLKAVSKLLPGFTFKECQEWGDDLIGPNGLRIWVRYSGGSKSDRWELSASVERSNEVYLRESERIKTDISVSSVKTAEKIARDIEKRLLPNALEYQKRIAALLVDHDEYVNAKDTVKDAAAKIMGVKPREDKSDVVSFYGEIYGSIQASRESCSIELRSVPTSLMKDILKIVKQFNDAHGEA